MNKLEELAEKLRAAKVLYEKSVSQVDACKAALDVVRNLRNEALGILHGAEQDLLHEAAKQPQADGCSMMATPADSQQNQANR